MTTKTTITCDDCGAEMPRPGGPYRYAWNGNEIILAPNGGDYCARCCANRLRDTADAYIREWEKTGWERA